MNWDRMIAVVGVCIGIPGFLLLFLSDKWAHGVLVLLLVCLCASWWYYTIWRDKQPVFTILHLEKKIVITDSTGKAATFTRTHKLKVNHKGITEWWCRNLAADGTISNIKIDGRDPDQTITTGGTIQICRRFPFPKERGEVWESTLTYDLADSFVRPWEETIHYTSFKTKKLIMEVDLPRACKRAELRFTFGGQQSELLPTKPEVSTTKQSIRVEIKRPRLGGQYHLGWEW